MRKRDLSYIDAEDMLKALGIQNVSRSGAEIDFSCPSANHSNGDQNPSARMNSRNLLWICHGCGLRGDAVDFVMLVRDLTESEAQRVLEERYGGPELSVESGGLRAEVERIMAGDQYEDIPRIPPDEKWLDTFRVGWPTLDLSLWDRSPFAYMIDRGFLVETLESWEIGYDAISDRITIPVRDKDGKLVGFKGRSWEADHHPKYILLGNSKSRDPKYDFDTYAKSEYVFGLNSALGDHVTITEGELNTIMLSQYGGHGAVSVAGSEFSQLQAEQIIDRFSSATVYFDNDDAGKNGTRKVLVALEPYMPVKVVLDAPDDAAALGGAAINVISEAISSLKITVL